MRWCAGEERGLTLERELKLGVGATFVLPDLDGVVDGAHAETIPPAVLKATYFDTEDLRLARWGGTLRFRSDEGWSVKLPAPEEGELLVRRELRFAGAEGTPPAAARDVITAISRAAPLIPVVKLRTRRKGVRLLGDDGSPVAEVVDDEVSVLDGRKVATRFREIEVELAEKASPDVAEAVNKTLKSAGAGEPDPTPKHVRALGARATARPDVAAAAFEPKDGANAADLIRAALSASTARLMLHDPGVRLDLDPEETHQARVSTRRLRADLRTFRPLLEPVWVNDLRAELKWLGGELGAVRDSDVLTALLREAAADFPEAERRAAERLLEDLGTERESARDRLLAAMRSDRYVLLLDRLVEASNAPKFVGDADEPSEATLLELGVKPWKKLRSGIKGLDDQPDDAALHRVRILTKRCRYGAEALAPLAGKQARSFAKAAAKLQDVLGRNQDASMAKDWLRSASLRAPAAEAFAAGMLAGIAAGWSREARADWSRAWRRMKRKQVPSWS